jgi:hypothetical protein
MRYMLEHCPDDEDRGPWQVHTTAWMYALEANDRPLVEYHWHPISNSHERLPHLHLEGGKTHLPTGRVLVEDVLRCAMQYGAIPRDEARWRKIDADNRKKFSRGATWGVTRNL